MAKSVNTKDTDRLVELAEDRWRPALSGWPMIFAWAAMIIFALHASTHMVGAGDTWVAMACGRHFINHGVDTVEPFSANSHDAGPTEQEIDNWPGPARLASHRLDKPELAHCCLVLLAHPRVAICRRRRALF